MGAGRGGDAEESTPLIDTNVLVYAFDRTQGKRHIASRRIVQDVFRGEKRGAVTNQVLAELYTVLTTRIARPLKKADAATIVGSIIDGPCWTKLDYTSATVADAADLAAHTRCHFWDGLIARTCLEHGIGLILTENVKDFPSVPDLVIRTPW
jgi:predicted nucleic acid-binding protein